MYFSSLRPMIWSADLQGTVDFYTGVLGFVCSERNDDWGWASLYRDDVEIMVTTPNEHLSFDGPRFTGSFYITVQDVDALWAELRDRVRVEYALETFEYGMRDFAIYDNNGYLLQFGTPVDV